MRARVLTIGHSTRPIDVFVELLQRYAVDVLVDVRRHPGSRTQPQYGQDALKRVLGEAGIGYEWMEALGGRRKTRADSPNTRWRNLSFRGYADYMQSSAFETALAHVERLADARMPALMCAEVLWWRCHRALVSDALQARGRPVAHIGPDGQLIAHPYTGAAWIDDGRLRYDGEPSQRDLGL
jgi:uncharacterized protein (DUF488 family)